MNAASYRGCDSSNLPSVEEVIAFVCRQVPTIVESETVRLNDTMGRVLAADVVAALTVPPCDRSAMDGFAYASGGSERLRLLGRARAGHDYEAAVPPGACVAIATGAAIPLGCDTVAMQEHCEEDGGYVVVSAAPGKNIRRKGEDFWRGAVLAGRGTKLNERHIGLLAAGGVETVPVVRKIRVALLSIGDELLPGAENGIRDANRAMLRAALARFGCEVSDYGVLPDDGAIIAKVLGEAAAAHDVIISSASTSVGVEDHVRQAARACGSVPLFSGVAIKPGKPIAMAIIGSCLHIALPGNPAAAFASFALIGLPVLRHVMGAAAISKPYYSVVAGFAKEKRAGHREYVRVVLEIAADGRQMARPSGDNGAAMLRSLAAGDGFVCLAEDVTRVTECDRVSYCSFAELLS